MTTQDSEIAAPATDAVDTIVLIHGLWVTARTWERWIERYRALGYRVLAPNYPGLEGEVEALRDDPSPIADLTLEAVVEHYKRIVRNLEMPPILIGHSQGGLITQILLDQSLGVAGVAIDSVAAEGVPVVPLSQIKSVFPVLSSLANLHKAVPFSPEQFHYALTNAMGEQESAEAYARYYIPAPGNIVWNGVLANITPGHQASYVNFKNNNRAPLLFIAGGADHLMPPAVNKSNAQRYAESAAVTDYREFPGRCHFTLGQTGWEEVADYALTWALDNVGNDTGSVRWEPQEND